MRFKVDISKWARQTNGIDCGGSSLRNDLGYQCCLGFCVRQMGVSPVTILGRGMPYDLANYIGPKRYEKIEKVLGFLADDAARINDEENYSDAEKQKRLKKLFKKNGHSITFFDSGRKPRIPKSKRPKNPKGFN